MKKTTILFAAAACLLATSCASKKDLVNCQNENRELQSSYSSAKEQLAAANSRVTSLEEALAAQKQQLEDQKKAYARLQKTLDQSVANASQNNISIDKLVDQINESNQYIRHLVEVKSKSDSLNMVLTNNLTRSLSKEELKEVDVQVLKGVVYISLADNMLYKSGSYEINSRAEETLSKIAKATNGRYYRATNAEELRQIYNDIDKLEKSKLDVQRYSKVHDVYQYLVLGAIIALLLEILLRITVFRRIP